MKIYTNLELNEIAKSGVEKLGCYINWVLRVDARGAFLVVTYETFNMTRPGTGYKTEIKEIAL